MCFAPQVREQQVFISFNIRGEGLSLWMFCCCLEGLDTRGRTGTWWEVYGENNCPRRRTHAECPVVGCEFIIYREASTGHLGRRARHAHVKLSPHESNHSV